MNNESLPKILMCLIFLENHEYKLPYGKIFWEITNNEDEKTVISVYVFLAKTKEPKKTDLFEFKLEKFQIIHFKSSDKLDKNLYIKENVFLLLKTVGYLIEKNKLFNNVCFSIIEIDKNKRKIFISVKDAPIKPFSRDILLEYIDNKFNRVITGTM